MNDANNTEQANILSRNQFGTFGGVFTPSILTILGVIMFLRAGFVIGQSGILGAIIILALCKLITTFTAASIAAVCTNMQVRGGGAYFMISRVLGPEFGGAIGIALFFAQALSVPFYILGFTEALVVTFPNLTDYFQIIALISAALLFVISYVGATWAIKAQYFIMALLGLSIIVFMGGAFMRFSPETLSANWEAGYTLIPDAEGSYNFWIILAIYFPAVTGILAGVNMSGDLRNPTQSIPQGTFQAVAVGFVIYLIQIFACGAAFNRSELIERPFEILKDHAMFGMGWLVVAGMFAAALSSALGSYLGAPRILQAVARDRILEVLKPFAKGTEQGDEPRRGLIFTGVLTVVVLLVVGNDAGGGALNSVAAIITMFFLYTYGMVNLAAFIEAVGDNPSFRPRFRVFHWGTALLGAIGCVGIAFLINSAAALMAVLVLGGLLWFIKTRELQTTFGDARRGFVFAGARKNLLRLTMMEEDPKNWRPTVLVFTGNPDVREYLVSYGVWLESNRGIVILCNVLVGTFEELGHRRPVALTRLEKFCRDKNIQAFPSVVVAPELMQGISSTLQASAIGPIRPNLVMFGWSSELDRMSVLLRYLRIAERMGMGLILLYARGMPEPRTKKRIDVWWRGHKNGELMVILAHLLSRNWEWGRSEIRVLRLIGDSSEREEARTEMDGLIDEARVDAKVELIESGKPFPEILHEASGSSDCVFLGFEPPAKGAEEPWHQAYKAMLRRMPTTILVSSTGIEDMRA
ncbi:Amino acid permease [Sulfidibacter corallicola]|uniref:Amino acid permease n=1 Tax=Sulfidibacter corallicola TaxID=2818388 RepID=A0A8A4TDL2_SULCO|nr:amino acid permease [Sulfidibacter corallicola]QTD47657.1 amino acid permease [Sulfidibacter corallicola]